MFSILNISLFLDENYYKLQLFHRVLCLGCYVFKYFLSRIFSNFVISVCIRTNFVGASSSIESKYTTSTWRINQKVRFVFYIFIIDFEIHKQICSSLITFCVITYIPFFNIHFFPRKET